MLVPTAMQSLEVGQDTPLSEARMAPFAFGTALVGPQLLPFQVAPKVPPAKVPLARQNVADGHDTASSWMVCLPAGFGVGVTRQVLPFQRSPRLRILPDLMLNPTATHEVLVAQETPSRKARSAPAGAGVC